LNGIASAKGVTGGWGAFVVFRSFYLPNKSYTKYPLNSFGWTKSIKAKAHINCTKGKVVQYTTNKRLMDGNQADNLFVEFLKINLIKPRDCLAQKNKIDWVLSVCPRGNTCFCLSEDRSTLKFAKQLWLDMDFSLDPKENGYLNVTNI